jgi:hypothetical protein
MVFGVGAAAALASIFFAYLRRLFRLERPLQDTTPLRWLAIVAAIAGCLLPLVGLVWRVTRYLLKRRPFRPPLLS